MVQQSSAVATASADSKYVSRVTVGIYNIGVFYPGSLEVQGKESGGENFIELVRLVTRPEHGWEDSLDASIRSLRTGEGIDDILRYLPTGTIAIYIPNALNGTRNQIPLEVGIADEIIGGNLEKVVAIVELWLKRKLEIEQ